MGERKSSPKRKRLPKTKKALQNEKGSPRHKKPRKPPVFYTKLRQAKQIARKACIKTAKKRDSRRIVNRMLNLQTPLALINALCYNPNDNDYCIDFRRFNFIMELTLGILILICALFLIVSILMQSGKSKRLSGTIAGGAETFFGKQKGQDINKKLSVVTNVIAVVFVILIIALHLVIAMGNADDASSSAADSSSESASESASESTSESVAESLTESGAESAADSASAAESATESAVESATESGAESVASESVAG